ncbi:MAG: bifunctional phosphoribosyl-AMP cyclohydrolase/phosphoribosyl-ATP diphosphatase HisIE [Clostridia bacterium]
MEEINFKFDEKGLLVAIAQDIFTGEVLMQAFMNKEAIEKTIETGFAHYFSRSRNCLWKKGESSGNTQRVVEMKYDCDADSILLLIEQKGGACHTGNRSCFYRSLKQFEVAPDYKIIFDVANTIDKREKEPVEGSYTNYLLTKGVEKICKKIGEEATESVIAAVAGKKDELVGELADLTYHSLVLMQNQGVSIYDVFAELMRREGKEPNPKYKNMK